MGQSKRFADHFDRVAEQKYAAELPSMSPFSLPQQAFGPQEMEHYRPHRPVWVWLRWPTGQLTRSPCMALAANDRVVLVDWEPGTAMSRTVVVFRPAVTHRRER